MLCEGSWRPFATRNCRGPLSLLITKRSGDERYQCDQAGGGRAAWSVQEVGGSGHPPPARGQRSSPGSGTKVPSRKGVVTRQVEAVCQSGLLPPLQPLALGERQRVILKLSEPPAAERESRDIEFLLPTAYPSAEHSLLPFASGTRLWDSLRGESARIRPEMASVHPPGRSGVAVAFQRPLLAAGRADPNGS